MDTLKVLSDINLRFDCGRQDFAAFKDSIVNVNELCQNLHSAISVHFNENQTIVQTFFWTTFLHFHFPKAVFMCNNGAYRGACALFSDKGRGGEMPDGQFAERIKELYRLVAQGADCRNLIEHCPENVQLERWLKYSISGYALCAYIIENAEDIPLPLTVIADSVFRNFGRGI